jgi:hypothetical protein
MTTAIRQVAGATPLVQWAAHSQPAPIQDMRVNHRRLHIFVTQQFLHGPNIVALLEQMQQMRRKTVAKGMTTDAFGDLCRTICLAHGPLQTTLTDVMAADGRRAGVSRQPV